MGLGKSHREAHPWFVTIPVSPLRTWQPCPGPAFHWPELSASAPLILADFVLVWEEDLRNQENPTQDKTDTREVWRETFLENLHVAGLKIDQVHCGKERVV